MLELALRYLLTLKQASICCVPFHEAANRTQA
jgi:hypothetical protein